MSNQNLHHSGVKGMKWGVRRYQNKDGSLTPAGKKRYEGSSEDSIKTQIVRNKKINEMTNQELRDANNRLQLERQYKELTKKTSTGKKLVKAYTATAATIAAVAGATTTYKTVVAPILKKYGATAVTKAPVGVKAKVAAIGLAREISKFKP